jgi:Flp pilus assembly protein TadG
MLRSKGKGDADPRRKRSSIVGEIACWHVGRAVPRLGADRSGSVAIEFAVLAPLFIVSFLILVEIGLVFLSYNLAEKSAFNLSRAMMSAETRPATERAAIALITSKIDSGFIGAPKQVTARPLTGRPPEKGAPSYAVTKDQPTIVTVTYDRVKLVPLPNLGNVFPKAFAHTIRVSTVVIPQ